jgi:hypothetical protein
LKVDIGRQAPRALQARQAPMPSESPTPSAARRTVEKFLKKNKAVLVKAIKPDQASGREKKWRGQKTTAAKK